MKNSPSDRDVPMNGATLEQEYEAACSVDKLKLHPKNPNEGDLGAIMESVSVNGFWGAVIAQKSTRFVVAGNHRLMAARELKMPTLPVIWVDVDEMQAMRMLAADNRHARLGTDNKDALTELLTILAMSDEGLAGTGYDGDDLDTMMAEMGEKPKGEKPERKLKVVVACGSPAEQSEILQRLLDMGLDAKPR